MKKSRAPTYILIIFLRYISKTPGPCHHIAAEVLNIVGATMHMNERQGHNHFYFPTCRNTLLFDIDIENWYREFHRGCNILPNQWPVQVRILLFKNTRFAYMKMCPYSASDKVYL